MAARAARGGWDARICIASQRGPYTENSLSLSFSRGPVPLDAPGAHRVQISMQPRAAPLPASFSFCPISLLRLPRPLVVGWDELKRPENPQ